MYDITNISALTLAEVSKKYEEKCIIKIGNFNYEIKADKILNDQEFQIYISPFVEDLDGYIELPYCPVLGPDTPLFEFTGEAIAWVKKHFYKLHSQSSKQPITVNNQRYTRRVKNLEIKIIETETNNEKNRIKK